MELNFDQIYAKHYDEVLKYIKGKMYPKVEVAEEITSDAFLKVYEKLHLFDGEKSSIKTWVYNIAKNTMVDYFRSIKTENDSKVNYLDYKHYTDSMYNLESNESTDNEMIYFETSKMLKNAIDKLDETKRKIADLRYFQAYKYKDIAVEMNMPINTVKIQISRIKDYLVAHTKLV
jgi:RNA polymerase sigma-70 factor (ECF subfamily)